MKKLTLLVGLLLVAAIAWFALKPGMPTVQVAETDGTTNSGAAVEETGAALTDFDNKATVSDAVNEQLISIENSEVYTAVENSEVLWYAEKVGGSHKGFVKVTDATVNVVSGQIIAGNINMDIASLKATDTESQALEDHLKSADFFDVTKYPTAQFTVTKVEGMTVTGLLTLKGVTKQISFEASKIAVTPVAINVMAEFAIDRNQRGVSGGAGMVSDYMQLTLDLNFNK